MKTKSSRSSSLLMISPSVLLLLGWMLVPLCMTVYFSFLRYNLLQPGATPFSDWENYYWFITDPSFNAALINTFILVGGVLLITTIGGLGAAILLDKPSSRYNKRINRVLSDVGRLLRMIDNLLDTSKIESGKVTIKKEKVYLKTVIESCISNFSEDLLENINISLNLDLSVNPPILNDS